MNEANLKPISKGGLSKEEAKKRGKKGGEASAKAKRERKLFKTLLLTALDTVAEFDGRKGDKVRHTLKEQGAIMLASRFAKGDLKAVEQVLAVIGEAPARNIDVTTGGERLMAPYASMSDKELAAAIRRIEKSLNE